MSSTPKITIGHQEAHEKLTARLLWKKKADNGYNDAGNVKDYTDASTRSLVTRARAAYGMRHTNDEQVDISHESWTFALDERNAEQEKLLRLARQLTDQRQDETEGATATLSPVARGKWHPIGAYNIANVTVTGALLGLAEEGVDYELDKENGRLLVLTGGDVAEGESLSVGFDQPGIYFEKFESQHEQTMYGDFIFEEYNQHSRMWLRRFAFTGYLNVTEFPQQTGEFGTYRVKVTPSGPVTYTKRPEAQTLPTHAQTTEAAAFSSSSSSKSSSSSGGSSSSSSS